MRYSSQTHPARFIDSLPGRVFLVILTTVVSAAVFTLLFTVNRWISPFEMRVGIIIALGLVAGLTARRFLGLRTRMLQFWVAAAAILAALAVTQPITAGYLGLNFSRTNPLVPDWQGLAQAALALVPVLFTVGLRRRAGRADMGSRSSKQQKITIPGGKSSSRTNRGNSTVRVASNSRKRMKIRTNSVSSSGNGVLARPRRWLRENLSRSVKVGGKARRPVLLRWRRKRPLQLSAVQEHRCPYCLEVVNPNDPRGIKVCRVCKTQHHADCWEVTGTCQVAHYEN